MNPHHPLLFLVLLLFITTRSVAQSDGTILVITNLDTKIMLDGIEQGHSKAGSPLKLKATPGEHYIEAQPAVHGIAQNKGEVTQVEAGKQKTIKIEFDINRAVDVSKIIPVAEVKFNIPGSVEVIAWQDKNPGQSYPHQDIFYAFEKGDEIILNISMTKNKNGTNIIEVVTYPAGVIKYVNRDFTELKDLKIKVDERSIYRFTLATNYSFDRNALVKIDRKPASAIPAGFNPNVSKQKIYKPVLITKPTLLTINSGGNTTSKGKSRVLLPVSLPPNTIEWYYRFSASKNPDVVKDVQKNFQLFDELNNAFLKTSATKVFTDSMVHKAVKSLAVPPGTDYCDIYLLEHNNISNFELKNDSAWKSIPQGTRRKLISGNIRIDCCNKGQYYLGIKKPDNYNNINVCIEVIAMTVTENYVMENE